jgi:hypothetical protein
MVNNFRLVERKKNGSDISKTRVVLGRVLKIAIYFFIAFLCGEVTARLDDYMRYRIPFLDQSSLEEALKIKEFGITRGRPNGRYQRWHLNGYGFRSSQFNIDDHSKRRIMILGASESFGTHESDGKSYVEVLEHSLSGRFQFINASIIGMPLAAMHGYWDEWLAQFKPDTVLILASPLFYLDEHPPAGQKRDSEKQPALVKKRNLRINSRIIQRLKNHFSVPAFIQNLRQESKIQELIDAHPKDWVFTGPPEQRLELYKDHLSSLIDKISVVGAKVVVLTQPLSAVYPSRSEDYSDILGSRTKRPRATFDVVWAFCQSCNSITAELAAEKKVDYIDLWASMTGKKDNFADLNHFSNAGAKIVADEIITLLSRVYTQDVHPIP